MDPLIPVLKQNADIVNGMMTIEIANFDEIFEEELGHEFTLRYKFNLPIDNHSDNETYLNNIWQSTEFSILSLTEENTFTLKVPLFLLSYSLEYNLNIKILNFDAEDAKLQTMACISSCNYTANIASILMESTFNIDDDIQYSVSHAAYVISGTVLEILENDMIKIKTDEGYDDDKLQDIVTIHKSEVYRYPIPNCFIIDITDRMHAETDLILNTEDAESIDVYGELCDTLNIMFVNEMFSIDRSEQHKDFGYMSSLIAANIHQFLYLSQYNYRIKCIFGDSYLLLREQWKYYLWRNYNDHKKGFIVSDPQKAINGLGYTCDICRSEVNWFEYTYHCKCEEGDGHDFCISCIHSLISQYYEMKPFIAELLNDWLDDHCIDEIVTFCVGKVSKFDVKNNDINNNIIEDIDIMDCDDIDQYDVIDDTQCVGSKRSMEINNSPRKRRRLQ